MVVLDGKKLAQAKRETQKQRVSDFRRRWGVAPTLSVVLVGDDSASQVYVRNKIKACEAVGMNSEEIRMSASTSEAQLIATLHQLNQNPNVHGILVQLPLPKGINSNKVMEHLAPEKDVDALTVHHLGLLFAGRPLVTPCTPTGVIELIKSARIPIAGRHAVVVGRSQIVGKPMMHLLLAENATVTVCHSQSKDLSEQVSRADILVVAAGKAHLIPASKLKKDCVVVDVGIHRTTEGLTGDLLWDVDPSGFSAYTPVPGGVGPMTIAKLLDNTLILAEHRMAAGLKG